jgi:hypothetical protein
LEEYIDLLRAKDDIPIPDVAVVGMVLFVVVVDWKGILPRPIFGWRLWDGAIAGGAAGKALIEIVDGAEVFVGVDDGSSLCIDVLDEGCRECEKEKTGLVPSFSPAMELRNVGWRRQERRDLRLLAGLES